MDTKLDDKSTDGNGEFYLTGGDSEVHRFSLPHSKLFFTAQFFQILMRF